MLIPQQLNFVATPPIATNLNLTDIILQARHMSLTQQILPQNKSPAHLAHKIKKCRRPPVAPRLQLQIPKPYVLSSKSMVLRSCEKSGRSAQLHDKTIIKFDDCRRVGAAAAATRKRVIEVGGTDTESHLSLLLLYI
ncbi:hypothetical protein Zmor_017960 [Zophobas morio]|uniref:Uncharacterized protein n=1 Tax=Zophobas morio TaxID=2755281 RepID=A0AA38ICF5_9CUCU|nr:hypothetical protein Zmor_017960 [Zophobas morio]